MADLAGFRIEPLGDTNLLTVRDESHNVLNATVDIDYLQDIYRLLREFIGGEDRGTSDTSEIIETQVAFIEPEVESLPEPITENSIEEIRLGRYHRRKYRPIRKINES